MKDLLKDINAVAGVTGSFVCNSEGQVLASDLPSLFDEAILSAVGRTVAQTMAGLAAIRRRKIGDIDLVYSQGRFIAKNLGEGCLCILCVRHVNVPLLNLTANVAAKKLTATVAERTEMAAREAAMLEARTARALVLNSEVRSFISTAQKQGVVLRATGDTAIRLRCPSADRMAPSLGDNILDLAGQARQSAQINHILESLGYSPERRFNFLYGRQRLRYVHPEKQLGVEVFLDELNSYHQLRFANRLDLDEDTISLADLLLWKLQFVELGEDDLRAIYIIVYDHELGGPGEPNKIDTTCIVDLCANDWGWYKTVTTNLGKSMALAESYSGDEADVFLERARRLLQMIEEAPKSGRWQLRARVGESVRWYEIPE
jgi:predicted regulator of Ras-like GTPase activity (Roadblock/LC7/MglB family)